VAHNIYMYCQFKMKGYIKVRTIIVTFKFKTLERRIIKIKYAKFSFSCLFLSFHGVFSVLVSWDIKGREFGQLCKLHVHVTIILLTLMYTFILNWQYMMRTTFDIYISITNTGYYLLKLKVLGVCGKKVKVPKHDNQNRLRLPIF
jgi:hypothetical protein